MPFKKFNVCNPCCDCVIADIDLSPTRFLNSSGLPFTGFDIEPGEYVDTPIITRSGYSLTAVLAIDLTQIFPSTGHYTINDDPDIYDGLRLEVVDTTGTVLQYAEVRAGYKFYLGQEFTPLIAELVRNAGPTCYVEICVIQGAFSFRSSFDTYGFTDYAGQVYSHNAGSFTYDTTASVPYTHDQDVRLRLRNTSDVSMSFPYLYATRTEDIEQVDRDAYGCVVTEPTITNEDCEPCSTICTRLPGNRVHSFEITDYSLPVTLSSTLGWIEYDGCGSQYTTDPFWDYTPNPSNPADESWLPVLNGTIEAAQIGTSQCYTWGATAVVPHESFVVDENNYRLTCVVWELNDCEVELRFELILNYTINPRLGSPDVNATTYTYAAEQYGTVSNPPPTGTNILNYSISGIIIPTVLTWTVNVPIWKATSETIRLNLDDAIDAPESLCLVTDYSFSHDLTSCPEINTGNYGHVYIDLAITEIMGTGSYIEVRGS